VKTEKEIKEELFLEKLKDKTLYGIFDKDGIKKGFKDEVIAGRIRHSVFYSKLKKLWNIEFDDTGKTYHAKDGNFGIHCDGFKKFWNEFKYRDNFLQDCESVIMECVSNFGSSFLHTGSLNVVGDSQENTLSVLMSKPTVNVKGKWYEIETTMKEISSSEENAIGLVYREIYNKQIAQYKNTMNTLFSIKERQIISKLEIMNRELEETKRNEHKVFAKGFTDAMSIKDRYKVTLSDNTLGLEMNIIPRKCVYEGKYYPIPDEMGKKREVYDISGHIGDSGKIDCALARLKGEFPHPNIRNYHTEENGDICLGDMAQCTIVEFVTKIQTLLEIINFDSAYYKIDNSLCKDLRKLINDLKATKDVW
jgi:hypothetical protein